MCAILEKKAKYKLGTKFRLNYFSEEDEWIVIYDFIALLHLFNDAIKV